MKSESEFSDKGDNLAAEGGLRRSQRFKSKAVTSRNVESSKNPSFEDLQSANKRRPLKKTSRRISLAEPTQAEAQPPFHMSADKQFLFTDFLEFEDAMKKIKIEEGREQDSPDYTSRVCFVLKNQGSLCSWQTSRSRQKKSRSPKARTLGRRGKEEAPL
jgi:hypothetical protein